MLSYSHAFPLPRGGVGIFPLLRSGVFGAQWEGLGVGGAHQQQECQKLAFSDDCWFQVTLHK
ncbi:MAG: hypothetical protein V3V82_07160, partial [Acidimicrobiia bacterium]